MEELKQRYKSLPLAARLGLLIIIALLPAVYTYLEQGQEYESRLIEVQNQEQEARTQFEKARQRKASLPKLEEQLAFTEDQLSRAKKHLPDFIKIEEILEKAALIAKDTSVTLMKFKPVAEVVHSAEGYTYVELPIETEIVGTYQRIASFLDRIAHLDSTIFVREIRLTPIIQQNRDILGGGVGGLPPPGPGGVRGNQGPAPMDNLQATIQQFLNRGQGATPAPNAARGEFPGVGQGGIPGAQNASSSDNRNINFQESAQFKMIVYRSNGGLGESLPSSPDSSPQSPPPS